MFISLPHLLTSPFATCASAAKEPMIYTHLMVSSLFSPPPKCSTEEKIKRADLLCFFCFYPSWPSLFQCLSNQKPVLPSILQNPSTLIFLWTFFLQKCLWWVTLEGCPNHLANYCKSHLYLLNKVCRAIKKLKSCQAKRNRKGIMYMKPLSRGEWCLHLIYILKHTRFQAEGRYQAGTIKQSQGRQTSRTAIVTEICTLKESTDIYLFALPASFLS